MSIKCTKSFSRLHLISAVFLTLSLLFAFLLTGCGQKTFNPAFEEILEEAEISAADVVTEEKNTIYFAGFDEFGNVDIMKITHDGDLITNLCESIYYLPKNYSEENYQGLAGFAKQMDEALTSEGHLTITSEELEYSFRITCDMQHLEQSENVAVLRDLAMLILEPGEDGLLSLEDCEKQLLNEMDFETAE